MARVHRLVLLIDRFTDICGRGLAWLVAAMALLTAAVVLLRYGLELGSIAAQEAVTYLHATLFMLGAAYALKNGAHVRVDIFYQRFTPRTRAWIDSLGAIVFLLPLCAVIGLGSLAFVAQAWSVHETSADAGGIPAVFLLKTLLPLMAANLALQGLAEVLRNALTLAGDTPA
ncbi:MAG TPA: TRAP transporter small permease subunit [Pseudohaliea sp.]|nr:TRAP transporter small permease subunit [Pseudohaliea sp.]